MDNMGENNLIKKLFNWSTKVTVEGIDFYVRIVNDAVRTDAISKSRIKSAKTRRSFYKGVLVDRDSDLYLEHIDFVNTLSTEEVHKLAVALTESTIRADYRAKVPPAALPKLGDFPSDKELEDYEVAVAERDNRYIEAMNKWVADWKSNFEKGISAMSRDSAIAHCEKMMIDRIIEDSFNDAVEMYILPHAIYKDPEFTQPAFTPDEFMQLPGYVRTYFVDAYRDIHIGGDEIKK